MIVRRDFQNLTCDYNKKYMKVINWEKEKNNLISYMNSGMSYKEIGEKYGVFSKTIRSVIFKLGIREHYKYKQKPWKSYTLTEEDIEGLDKKTIKKLKRYRNLKYKNTRNFIISELRKDPDIIYPKGIIVKEDIIEQYNVTREDKPKFNYDFSKLPLYINDTHDKFTIIVNEVSTKTGKIIGEWNTCFKEFIITRSENRSCRGMINKKYSSYTTEEFVEICRKKFGDIYGYDKVNYINFQTPIILKCNKCGKYFSQRPTELLYGAGRGCPKCIMREVGDMKFLGIDELEKRCNNIYGNIYDFSKSIYRGQDRELTVINKKTGEFITGTPEDFLRGCIERDSRSKGERIIEDWLVQNNIKYKSEVSIKSEIFKRKTGIIRVDFILYVDNKTYWVEYNGEQHYKNSLSGIFGVNGRYKEQCLRDDSEKEYCLKNNIELIEIPYTYDTVSKISEILERLFIKKEPKDFIVIPEREEVCDE